jgi:citronellyl-CoA synthetase
MARTLYRGARLQVPDRAARMSLGSLLAMNARAHGQAPALICEGETISWAEFNARANRVAHALRERHGIGHGDAVALMMENRIAFLTTLFGICKLGAVAGLINTNQRREVLHHSLELIGSRMVIVGEELVDAMAEVQGNLALEAGRGYAVVADPGSKRPAEAPCPGWATPLSDVDPTLDDGEPEELAEVILGDPCFYIFTSGTTGLPKAAVVSNARCLRGMQGSSIVCLNAGPTDRLYNCLPLYHSTGLIVGFGAPLLSGASMFIRRRFSASAFLAEARAHETNMFVYVGELCRYLLQQPQRPDDADNPITKVIGNGLRPDIWNTFKDRFGISRVYEIYGASEGNSGFINAFSKDSSIGFGISPHKLVRYDVTEDAIVRGADGFCIEVDRGEPGLLLNEIREDARFDGYTDRDATERKIVRDVLRSGDAYFNTGDLVKEVDVGFAFWRRHYQFVDRTGDTFRWKGENCSTNEVGEILNGFAQVQTANVYGVAVPDAEGRAGMAAITFDPATVRTAADVDWDGFSAHVRDGLPAYARPLFIRVQHEQETTSTFKLRKQELKEEAFHPDRVQGEAIYVLKPGSERYEPLDETFYEQIMEGRAGF